MYLHIPNLNPQQTSLPTFLYKKINLFYFFYHNGVDYEGCINTNVLYLKQ